MSTRKRSTKSRSPKVPRLTSPRRGVLEVGGSRTSLVDVLAGFYGIRSALRRQVGICEKCIIREAGREAALSFVRTARSSGAILPGLEGLEQALESYSASGFGDFRLETMDWERPLLELQVSETFEGWAFAQR